MRIYIGHSREFDFKKELYKPLRESAINSKHEIILPHEAKDFVTKNIIKKSNVMIAEVSYPSTGLGIELEWANSFKIPIFCVYKKGSKISDSLEIVCNNFIKYSDKNDLIKKIENVLSKLD